MGRTMGEADDVLAPACGLLELRLGAREQQRLFRQHVTALIQCPPIVYHGGCHRCGGMTDFP